MPGDRRALEVSRPQPLGWVGVPSPGPLFTAVRGVAMVKRTFLAFVCVSLLMAGSAPVRPVLASPDSVDQIDQQLSAQKAELDELNARVEHANGELDRLDEQLARDELRLGQLR